MNAVKITAALIAKNEERFLEACLRSCRPLVDEIVVVDTGSTDRTRQIARDMGAKLADFAWTGRFDDARNFALDHSLGSWILYIDADETVLAPSVERLRATLADPAVLACRCQFHPRVGYTAYQEVRLFRKDPRIRFRGAIHESVTPDIERLVSAGHGRIAEAPMAISHFGYEGDMSVKHARNLPLLRVAIEESGDRIYLHSELARTYRGLGRTAEARSAWLHAIELVRASRAQQRGAAVRRDPVHAAVYADFIDLELLEGRAPVALAEEALAHHGDDPQVLWVVGNTFGNVGEAERAISLFHRLIEFGEMHEPGHGMKAFDARLFTLFPHLGLARAYVALGRHVEAAHQLLRAAKADPENAYIHLARAAACQAIAAMMSPETLRSRARPQCAPLTAGRMKGVGS